MLLKTVRLRNIRSYLDDTIAFPEGSVLLSGDIGCGKSTVLLAVEFALFGLLRGEIAGAGLLRNGRSDGSVELAFALGGREVTISRALRRTRTGVEQEAGWIAVDGRRQVLTAQELRAAVLELLGYPPDQLTKAKNPLFRYTVYTPQEEMKRILFADADERLNVLRKVFDMDRYRRVRENTAAYLRAVRERSRQLEGFAFDLEEKRRQAASGTTALAETEQELQRQAPALEEAAKAVEARKRALEQAEGALQKFLAIQQETRAAEAEQRVKEDALRRLAQELPALEAEIAKLEQELAGAAVADAAELARALKANGDDAQAAEQQLRQLRRVSAEHEAHRTSAQELKRKISALDSCPLCLQHVTAEHKGRIGQEQDFAIARSDTELAGLRVREQELERQLAQLKTGADALRQRQQDALVLKVRLQGLEERRQRRARLAGQRESLVEDIAAVAARRGSLQAGLQGLSEAQLAVVTLRQELERFRQRHHELDVRYHQLLERVEHFRMHGKQLADEIVRKEQARAALGSLQKLQHWLDERFLGIVNAVEQQVLARVHQEFDGLFQQWFAALVEDEMLTARLGTDFGPLVQQNGYDIEVDHLSGGERTACALAYRLALNKVINHLISSIQTKDLIILDEPTDGFSSEQLDRMRDVLRQLQLKQVILVSHERQVESFVEHVIRVEKRDHASQATTVCA
jgi:exonuclease SbcC